MEKLDLTTPNFTDENIQKLSELFPNCVTEDSNGKAIDFDALKQELSSNIVEGNKESYQLSWPGKAKSIVVANAPINKSLRPNRKDSKDFDDTKNLYIEGDNLEVLKLLQETYLNKIKMIYIDPPYNTGNDILYKNDFSDSQNDYLELSKQADSEGFIFTTNSETNGRFHSDWLSMMYPRVKLARNVLTDDGILVLAIDHNELNTLTSICDEIFGVSNRIGIVSVVHKPEGRNQVKFLAPSNEYMLFYAKDHTKAAFRKVAIDDDVLWTFDKEDSDGKYRLNNYLRSGGGDHNLRENKPNFYYPVYVSEDLKVVETVKQDGYTEIYPITNTGQERTWKTIKETLQSRIKEGKVVAEKDNNGKVQVYEKYREQQIFKTHWQQSKYHAIHHGTNLISNLLNARTFDFPKSLFLVKDVLKIISTDDDLILDFFSGSATTAHAVMQLNAEDGGSRKFIMAQIPEATDEKSEAYKAGYNTIAEIGKERIRRAGEKIKEDNADKEGISDLDIGFRVLKVDSSNMKDVYFSPDNTSQDDMFDLASNIKDDRTDEDLLFMVLLDWGIDLSVKIERREVAGKTVYFADDNFLAACFEENLDEDFVKALTVEQPLKVVLRDSGFASSSVKINVEQIFKQADIEVKVI